jgi:NADH-quinone oxidoreductase subunit B
MSQDFNNPGYDIPPEMLGQVSITTLDKIYNWGRRSSIWPMFFGLACCAIEMICAATSRFDFARFGMEIMRPSPRQADLMIIAGTVTKKMIPQIVRLYNQMPEPKYVLAMGACASGGGPFKEGYNVVSGVDEFLPVDVYVPGCPPTPQALLNGFITLQKLIDKQSIKTVRWYRKGTDQPIPVPILGPDLIDSRKYVQIKEYCYSKLQSEQAVAQAVPEDTPLTRSD